MSTAAGGKIERFRRGLEEEYARRFPRSRAHFDSRASMLDGASHAIRWNEPFMPVAFRAEGPGIEDLDGHHILDYWQGHFANILGHNPPLIRDALSETLMEGRGLQSGMLHEIEGEVCDLICRCTASETVRLTTSGSLAVFYAVLLARSFTGRDKVLKVAGGWHGSQPFGLKGVSARGASFDHLESEGLSATTAAEIVLTSFNDVEDLRGAFARHGDRLACFVVEPMLGAGGGMAATDEYLREARRLTEHYGALLLCDEIITAFRFHAGDLTSLYGIHPDLLILGKILGGGMPVAAVAGRRDVMSLCTRGTGRVKFEGGTYSAHELSLVAARTMVRHLLDEGDEVYGTLSDRGARLREGLRRVARQEGVAVFLHGTPNGRRRESSLIMLHVASEELPHPTCPEELVERGHPLIDEKLLKSVLLLEDLSTRSGIGAVSTTHSEDDIDRTLEAVRAAFRRLKEAGLV